MLLRVSRGSVFAAQGGRATPVTGRTMVALPFSMVVDPTRTGAMCLGMDHIQETTVPERSIRGTLVDLGQHPMVARVLQAAMVATDKALVSNTQLEAVVTLAAVAMEPGALHTARIFPRVTLSDTVGVQVQPQRIVTTALSTPRRTSRGSVSAHSSGAEPTAPCAQIPTSVTHAV
jgi:hypothetical protein